MKRCSKLILLLLISFLSLAASPPNEMIQLDLLKVQIYWTWSQGPGLPAATGFKIYCGAAQNLSAPSTVGQTFTDVTVVDVPDKLARNYLIGPVILPILTAYGIKTPHYRDLLLVTCVVSPYNTAGEATDGTIGAPRGVSSTYFVTRN